ncbi:unnamed protein product [Agarophyton chilense]
MIRQLRLLPLLGALLLSTVVANALEIMGAAFSTGHDTLGYRQWYVHSSLQQLKSTGANFVQISVYSKMPNLNAMYATQNTDDESIRFIVRKVKSMGFKVFLKPVVEIEGDTWRGFLAGSPLWFEKVYRPFINHMARIAQQERVEVFSIGSEYRNSEVQVHEWNKVIDDVKKLYFGRITYIANHDSYKRFQLWHRLHFISISAYFQLLPGVRGSSPNLEETKKIWRQKADEIWKWRAQRGLTAQKVVMAEVGVQSKGDGVVYRVPWDWKVNAPVNFDDQAKMYEGICNAFSDGRWVGGILFWNWELQPNAGTYYPTAEDYTPQNKPAQQVMRRYFSTR